jgi:hypothetical protein
MKRLRDGIVLPSTLLVLASAPHYPRSGLKASTLSFEGNRKGGEWNFRAPLNRARRQQAKSWELHVDQPGTAVARPGQTPGCLRVARFTEGFDTKDLREAKALLTELR